MAASLVVGARYIYLSGEVTLVTLETGRAFVRASGAGDLLAVKPEDLKPLPEPPDFSGHAAAKIDPQEWDRAASLAGVFKTILGRPEGRSVSVGKAAKEFGMSERQVWRLLKIYEENPVTSSLLALKPGRREGVRMLADAVEEVIHDRIEACYLKTEKPTLAALQLAIGTTCRKRGLKPPSPYAVRKRVEAVDLKLRMKRREGSKRAGEACDGVPGHLMVQRPLERVEIDHTRIDVVLRADTPKREVVGRPWLTLAVDCFTRMVLGFYIGFEAPSSASVAMCLAMAAQRKEGWLERNQVRGDWPACGIPKEIWVDNALEFRSEAMRRGCQQYMVTLNYRPVGVPSVGGTIERLIGTMMGAVHLLPGTTQSNVIERGDYDAEARATMTLSEFVPWFTEMVVTQYHLRLHRGLGVSPMVAWKRAMGDTPPELPRDTLEFYASFLPAQERRLTRTGIQMHQIGYWSDEFSPWIGHKKDVLVHYHRMDVGHVYVRLPDGRLAVAEADKKYAKGLSLADWRGRLAHGRSVANDPGIVRARDEGFRRNEERTKSAAKATRNVGRVIDPAGGNEPGASPGKLACAIPAALQAITVVQFD